MFGGGSSDKSNYYYSHLFTSILAMDGNFKAYTKSKRFDVDDKPLTDGSGFFPEWSEWNKYCESHKELPSVSKSSNLQLSNPKVIALRIEETAQHMTKCTPSQLTKVERFPDCAPWSAHDTGYLVRLELLISRRARSTLPCSIVSPATDSGQHVLPYGSLLGKGPRPSARSAATPHAFQ